MQMRRTRGFTLYEFAVCASVFALLAAVLLAKLREYQAESEAVATQHLVAAVRTALAARAAQAAADQGESGLVALTQENPLKWLARPPINYLGEYYRPGAQLLKPGHWYFDRHDKTINFLQSRDTFSFETSKLLKFKVELLREPDPNRSGRRTEATQGLVFDRVSGRDASDNH
jgi:general secretion pathway protein G